MNELPVVSVVVINWNSGRYLELCMRSLRRQTYPNVEVTVVDNASSDGSVDLIEGHCPEVQLIKNATNQGFCKPFNEAVRSSSGEFVMPLNADVFMTPSFLEELVRVADASERVGSVTGKLLKAHVEDKESCGAEVLYLRSWPMGDRRRAVRLLARGLRCLRCGGTV
jgi:GT2 family glycosyltransferase